MMYMIAQEIETWLGLGVAIFVCCMGGQLVESYYPGNMILIIGFILCLIGALSCSAYIKIYEKGWVAGRSEKQPQELENK